MTIETLESAVAEQSRARGPLATVALLAVGVILATAAISAAGPDDAGSTQPAVSEKDQTGTDAAARRDRAATHPAAPEGTVVDGEGHPLAEVAVFLSPWPGRSMDGAVPTLVRATTDEQGRFRMAAPPASAFDAYAAGTIWAFKPGLAFGAAHYTPSRSQEQVRIRLDPPGKRVFTLKRRDGSPSIGVKAAPGSAIVPNSSGMKGATLPDELIGLMVQISDERGKVVITSFPANQPPDSLRVWFGPGGSQFVRPSEEVGRGAEQVDLLVEPAGALAGVVRRPDGKSPGDLTVRLEVEPGAPVRLEGGPVRVSPDGAFRMPPVLLAGSRYRAIIQGDNQRPFVSPWIEPAGEGRTAELGDLVLETLQAVSGRVIDRQGKPIAGAQVIQSGDGPERTTARTDAEGRYRLGGYQDGRGLIFARAEGFRFGGRVVAPGENAIVLTRLTESPERALPTLPPPLPAAELRSLARRVLKPYLESSLDQHATRGILDSLRVLMILDPAAALELLPGARLEPGLDARLRGMIAAELARTDPDEGTAVAESLTVPADRAGALLKIADVLPPSAKARRLDVFMKAVVHVRASADPDRKLWILGDAAERLVDEGELGKAKNLFDEALALARAARNTTQWRYFAARLARVDLAAALDLIEAIPTPEGRSQALANTAVHIAASRPADCERLLARVAERDRGGAIGSICDRMVRVDPDRARRLAGGFDAPYARALLRIVVARGLVRTSKAEAERLFHEAMAVIDDSLSSSATIGSSLALWLPLVEEISPELVAEFLWRRLSLRRPATGLGAASPAIRSDASIIQIVARYDRELADALWAPIRSRIWALEPGDASRYGYHLVVAQAHLDPRAAVKWVESEPLPARVDERGQNEPRWILAELLARWSVGRDGRLLPHVNGSVEELPRRDLD